MAEKATPKVSQLFKSIKGKVAAAHKKHQGDETVVKGGAGDCPAGVENGRARLSGIKVDTYASGDNKGKLYFSLSAIVLTPESILVPSVGAQKIQGLRTYWQEPLCDTKTKTGQNAGKVTTFEEHYANMLNYLRLLGVDTESISEDDMDSVFEGLLESKPVLKFRSWSGQPTPQYPNPRVNYTLQGVDDEFNDEVSPESMVEEGGETSEETQTETEGEEEGDEPPTEETESGAEDDGLDQIVADCDAKDKKAANRAQKLLKEKAMEAGISEEDFDNAENWAAVVEMIRGGSSEEVQEEVQEEETQEEEWKPEAGDVYKFQPTGKDPKTNKPYTKPIEVTVESVNEKASQVKIKSLDNKKLVWDKVAWDRLIRD